MNIQLSRSQQTFFTHSLLSWYEPERRPLPWKHIKEPYFIWLSEIILQQTRVEQGRVYYERFIKVFPSVDKLAAASQDEVFKLWEGLGYYSRARNLHASAKIIVNDLNNCFPNTYKELLALKGVGPYTAAAVASFAYGLPHAVVDGNVYRVLSRFMNSFLPIDSTEGKKAYQLLAQKLLAVDQAAIYNQAIMDLGATVCTPKKPDCDQCPLIQKCGAYAAQTIDKLPIKVKKIKKTKRYFHFLLIEQPQGFFIHKREQKDIWQGLYQFPLIESSVPHSKQDNTFGNNLLETCLGTDSEWIKALDIGSAKHYGEYKQTLTHQQIFANFWKIKLSDKKILASPKGFLAVKPKKWRKFAFPKIISLFFDDNRGILGIEN